MHLFCSLKHTLIQYIHCSFQERNIKLNLLLTVQDLSRIVLLISDTLWCTCTFSERYLKGTVSWYFRHLFLLNRHCVLCNVYDSRWLCGQMFFANIFVKSKIWQNRFCPILNGPQVEFFYRYFYPINSKGVSFFLASFTLKNRFFWVPSHLKKLFSQKYLKAELWSYQIYHAMNI